MAKSKNWKSMLLLLSTKYNLKSLRRRIERETLDEVIAQIQTCSILTFEFLCRFAEVHIHRLVYLMVILMATYVYSVFNFVYLLLVILALCLPRFKNITSLIIGLYLIAVFIAQMVGRPWVSDSPPIYNKFPKNQTLKEWIGFHKRSNFEYLFQALAFLSICAQFAIYFYQRQKRSRTNQTEPLNGIIFSDSTNAQLFDSSLLSGFKVAINYLFYKFGLELSMILMITVAWQRMDLIACAYIVLVFVLVMLPRKVVRILWPFIIIGIMLEWLTQYVMELGLYGQFNYPWYNFLENDFPKNETKFVALNKNLLDFVDLPDDRVDQRKFHLIADFFLFMVAIAQWFVFLVESSKHPAGDNNTIYKDGKYTLRKKNPHYDFIAEKKSFVDIIKHGLFMYGHWITVMVLLFAGFGGTSVFTIGYLGFAFWLLWLGNTPYTMKNYRSTLIKWNIVCTYNLLAMLVKTSLQLVGCVFIWTWDSHYGEKGHNSALEILSQLFGIACAKSESQDILDLAGFKNENTDNNNKLLIGRDLIAFICIIFQLRILHSHFFQRCIVEYRCEVVQASRGAILSNQLIEKQMLEQNNHQRKKFYGIRRRMVEIRKHYIEQQNRAETTYKPPETYADARLAGDYYLFEHEDCAEDAIKQPEERYVKEVEPGSTDVNKLDPTQLMHVALNRDFDLEETLDSVKRAEEIPDEQQRMIEAVSRKSTRTQSNASNNEAQQSTHENQGGESNLRAESDKDSKTKVEKVFAVFRFIYKLFTSLLHHLIGFFNWHSREHRYISFVLNKEKVRLKTLMEENLFDTERTESVLRNEWRARGLHLVSSVSDISRFEDEVQDKWQQRQLVGKCITAIGSFLASYTHVLCYIMACVVHGVVGGLLTLPLPLMVFCWATLSNPRPPKIFWIIMISYTEFIIIVHFIFRFGFWSWNKENSNTDILEFGLPDLFGVHKKHFSYVWEFILLFVLFVHRYMLQSVGLWDEANAVETFADNDQENNSRRQSLTSTEEVNLAPDAQSCSSAPAGDGAPSIHTSTDLGDEPQRRGFSLFYYNLKNRKICYVRDCYPYMFFLDIVCLLIIVFKYDSFGEVSSTSNVLAVGRVPISFVLLIIIWLTLMIIDRALYLCKSVHLKLYFQLFLVVLLHVWILGILPYVTNMSAVSNIPAAVFYVFKCLYLIVSAWQIRNGYPRLCIGNLLTHSYGLANYVLFMIYFNVPLLFEIRTIVDWTYTDTVMPVFDFLKMENIYAQIFMVKCSRVMDETFPVERGTPKPALVKYPLGILIVIIIIGLALSPLIAYSIINRVGVQTGVRQVDLTISLQGYSPFYKMSAEGHDIINRAEYAKNLSELFKERFAMTFIKEYFTTTVPDIYYVNFRPESNLNWPISDASLQAMKTSLSDKKINHTLEMSLKLVRVSQYSKEPVVHTRTEHVILNSSMSNAILQAINTPGTSFKISNLLPYYLVAPTEGQIHDAYPLIDVVKTKSAGLNISMANIDTYSDAIFDFTNSTTSSFWTMQFTNKTSVVLPFNKITYGSKDKLYVPMIFFVDRLVPAFFASIVSGGIIAMYVAFVLVAARVLRSIIYSSPLEMIISEMPNPDPVLNLCLDIYLVREAKDFFLEEDLWAKLIFLFRSPETIIKWTRPKKSA